MGIFDTVSNLLAPAQQAAPNQPVAPVATAGNIPNQATPSVPQAAGTEANGTVPNQVAPAQAAPDSPMAEFANLWETNPSKQAGAAPNAPLSAEAVQQAVAKTNFSQSITPETLAAVAAGGEEAQQAFSNALNQVAQQVMVQSTMVNNKLTEKAITDALAVQQASLPDMLRSQQAADHLKTSNPIFSNPAIKPVIEATQQQLLQKFPNATSAELTQMTEKYITEMGTAFAPQTSVNDNAGVSTDWDAFLNPQ